jgi:hypothetical protein
MKRFFLILTFALSYSGLSAQSELWGKTAGGPGDEEAEGLVLDASGNVYVTGFFKSSSFSLGDKVLKNKGSDASDVFLAKYDKSGKLLWVKTAGGQGEDEPLAISLDKEGNIILRGFFEGGSIAFDNVSLENKNPGDMCMFLAKYDPSGKVLWAKSAEVLASAHTIDNANNIIVAGELMKDLNTSFDDLKFTPASQGMFIAKYSPEGKVLWVKKGAGSKAFSISADDKGNSYVSGEITGVEHSMEGGTKIVNAGPAKTDDIVILKLSSDGNIIWERSVGGQGKEETRAQYVSKDGSFYVVVRFTSIKLKLDKNTVKNGGGDDLLLLKFSSDGNLLWAKNAGGSGHDNPIYMVADKDENIFLTGHFYSSKISFDNLTLSNLGLNDIFLVKFAPDGKVLWAKTTGSSHHDYPNGLLADREGNVYLMGEFNSNPNKNKITSEFFIEKYDPSGNMVWKSNEHRTEVFDFAFGESIDNDFNLYVVGYFEGNLKFAGTNYKSGGNKDLFILKYNVKKP